MGTWSSIHRDAVCSSSPDKNLSFYFFLLLLARSIMNIMPGSANLEILRRKTKKQQHTFSCVLTKLGVP